MRSRRPSPAQQEAVARRLALLDAELSAVRTGAPPADLPPSDPEPFDPQPPDPEEGHVTWDVAPPAAGGPPPVDRWAAPDTHTRPRGDPPDDAHDGAVIGSVPRTGRHAHRRPVAPTVPAGAAASAVLDRGGASGWAALVPDTLRGRAALGPAHLAVVAVLVSIGLGLTCWWVLRAGPEPLLATTPVSALVTPAGASGPTGEPGAASTGSTPVAGGEASPVAPGTEVVVDVAGRVRRPGIVVLPGGSRVADALEAAGGARPGTDLTPLNLARVLLDGEQVLVGIEPVTGTAGLPVPSDPGVGSGTGATGATPAPGSPTVLVNVNTADMATLDTLPGVGPVTAQAILDWRSENGGFSAVADLLDVSGIGEVTLAELTPLVTV